MLPLFLLALALAADAFAVSIARGAAGPHSIARALETGLAFGAAQGIMPLLGWALGALFMAYIAAVDHWIAFGLLSFLGVRMLFAAFSEGDDDAAPEVAEAGRGSHVAVLLIAAFATSIDAAAAGLTLDLFGLPVWFSCAVIAGVTAAVCVPAYWFASRIGGKFGHMAEGAGGVVLVGLGAKILFEHMAWV
ncbi:manganese efflux pump MntP family protein [Altererythrobacter lauratis]|uniref:Putative manganese efflux pump MntP n=1 Tax=Alteraurantiacibacter lauratis TaxID=2054627 RepID=A0ABV7EF85_9SPHN